MNNTRRAITFILALCMIITTMLGSAVTVYASAPENLQTDFKEYANSLLNMDLISGMGGDDPLGMNIEVTREQAITMVLSFMNRAIVAKQLTDAEIENILSKYPDSGSISQWARALVAYATSNGYVGGRTNGTYDPQGSVSGREFATMLLNAMGYSTGSGNDYEFVSAVEFLTENAEFLGDSEEVEYLKSIKLSALTRGDTFAIMYCTLRIYRKGSTERQIHYLINEGKLTPEKAFEEGLVASLTEASDAATPTVTPPPSTTPVPSETGIASVEPISANRSVNQIKINFKSPVAEGSSLTVKLLRNNTQIRHYNESLSEDRMTYTLKFYSALSGDYVVSATGFKGDTNTYQYPTQIVSTTKIVSIEFLADIGVVSSSDSKTATAEYVAKNAYGEDITNIAAPLSVTAMSATTGSLTATAVKGIMTFTSPSASFKDGDQLNIFSILNSDYDTANFSISLRSKISLISIVPPTVYNASGKILKAGEKASDYYLIVDAIDELGRNMTANALNTYENFAVMVFGTAVTAGLNLSGTQGNYFVNVSVNNVTHTALKLTAPSDKLVDGSFTLYLYDMQNNISSSTVFDIAEATSLSTLVLTQSNGTGIIVGETAKFDVTAYDTDGKIMTSVKDICAGLKGGTMYTSIPGAVCTFVTENNKPVLNVNLATATYTEGMVLKIYGNRAKDNTEISQSFAISESRYPKTTSGIVGVDTKLIKGTTFTLTKDNFAVMDQYGKTMSPTLGTKYRYFLVPSNDSVLSFSKYYLSADSDYITVTATGEGSISLVFMVEEKQNGIWSNVYVSTVNLQTSFTVADMASISKLVVDTGTNVLYEESFYEGELNHALPCAVYGMVGTEKYRLPDTLFEAETLSGNASYVPGMNIIMSTSYSDWKTGETSRASIIRFKLKGSTVADLQPIVTFNIYKDEPTANSYAIKEGNNVSLLSATIPYEIAVSKTLVNLNDVKSIVKEAVQIQSNYGGFITLNDANYSKYIMLAISSDNGLASMKVGDTFYITVIFENLGGKSAQTATINITVK